MMINIDNIKNEQPTFTKPTPNEMLVIDNGTYMCKAGFKADNPQITFRNKIYKYKDQFTLENKPLASPKTMFEKDIIINFEILEGTLDYILNYLLFEKNEYSNDEEEFSDSVSEEVFLRKKVKNNDIDVKKESSAIKSGVENKMPENIIFTHCLYAPKMFQSQLVSLLFEVYGFKKVQIGIDCFYSYLQNIKKENRAFSSIDAQGENEIDVVISISHMNTYVLGIQNEKILKHYKLPFGSHMAADYLLLLINNKYGDISFKMTSKETNHLLKYVQVGINYNERVMEIYQNMIKGYYQCIVDSKTIKYTHEDIEKIQKPKNEEKKPRKKVVEQKSEVTDDEQINTFDVKNENLNTEDNDDEILIDSACEIPVLKEDVTANMTENEKMYHFLVIPDSELTKEEIKQKRKYNIIYFSTLYRLKQKIEKEKKKLRMLIEDTEETLEKCTDLVKYTSKIKERYDKWKKNVKNRERIKREIKNKKSKEFMVMMKISNGSELITAEEIVLQEIEDANDEEMELISQKELFKYKNILLELDPDYLYEENPVKIVRGDQINIHGLIIDIELLRIGEIFFDPNLIGLTQPGITEILEDFRNYKIKNVFLTGGLSKMHGLAERISHEVNQNSLYGNVKIVTAEDSANDVFKGAEFASAFPIYTKEDFERVGAEKLIEENDLFC